MPLSQIQRFDAVIFCSQTTFQNDATRIEQSFPAISEYLRSGTLKTPAHNNQKFLFKIRNLRNVSAETTVFPGGTAAALVDLGAVSTNQAWGDVDWTTSETPFQQGWAPDRRAAAGNTGKSIPASVAITWPGMTSPGPTPIATTDCPAGWDFFVSENCE